MRNTERKWITIVVLYVHCNFPDGLKTLKLSSIVNIARTEMNSRKIEMVSFLDLLLSLYICDY